MKLYLLSRLEPQFGGGKHYVSAVVCAMGTKSAREMHPSGLVKLMRKSRAAELAANRPLMHDPEWPCYVEDVSVKYLGKASSLISVGVICANVCPRKRARAGWISAR